VKRGSALLALALCASSVVVFGSTAFAEPKAKRQPTVEQLQAHLLALEDMPVGYALDQTPPTGASQTLGFCNGPNFLAMVEAIPGSQHAGVSYEKNPVTGPVLGESAYSFPTTKAAKSLFAQMKKVAKGCTAWDGTSPSGNAYHYTLTASSAAKAGDQSLSYRLTAGLPDRPGTISSAGDVALVRSGRVVVNVQQTGLTLDSELTPQYVVKALKKIDPLLGS
jgi:hypothetical protein